MKEAYTKALGLGMTVNFDELEIRLYGTDFDVEDDEEEEEEGIWNSIGMRSSSSDLRRGSVDRRRYYSAIGRVKRLRSTMTTSWDAWEFIFVPLGDDDLRTECEPTTCPSPRVVVGDESACACICRGPLPKNASDGLVGRCPIVLESLTLTDLIRLHGNGPL
jgi:hypothetical protein